jgi:Tat protein translocase TatB subunit
MSFGEILLALGVAVVALGPKQLPVLMKYFGKFMSVYHQGRAGLKRVLDESLQAQQLDDNLKKAQKADDLYHDKSS